MDDIDAQIAQVVDPQPEPGAEPSDDQHAVVEQKAQPVPGDPSDDVDDSAEAGQGEPPAADAVEDPSGDPADDIAEKYRRLAAEDKAKRAGKDDSEQRQQGDGISLEELRRAATNDPAALLRTLGVDTEQLIPRLLGAAQEQRDPVQDLQRELTTMRQELQRRDMMALIERHESDLRKAASKAADTLPIVAARLDKAIPLAVEVQHKYWAKYKERLPNERALELVEEHLTAEAERWAKAAEVKRQKAAPAPTVRPKPKTIAAGKASVQPPRDLSLDEQIDAILASR